MPSSISYATTFAWRRGASRRDADAGRGNALRMITIARVLGPRGLGAPLLGRLALPAFLAVLLGYGGLFAYHMLANFDIVNLVRDTLIDDAFYYFEIARNLAAGKFSTFDGGITRTNGYHPAWLLLITPFYWVFDIESALFGIKALEIMLIAGGVCLLAVALRLAQLPWILLFAMLPALYCQRGMITGMEAALGAFFLGGTLLAAVLFARDPRQWRWLLAGVAFLLPWVRLEYVAIALFVTGGLALGAARRCTPSMWGGHTRPASCGGAARLPAAFLPFVAAIAGALAYVLYNGAVFGGVLPVSAAAKLADGLGPGSGAGAGWEEIGGWLAAAEPHVAVVAELCGYMLVVWGIARFRGWGNEAICLFAILLTVLAFSVENLAARTLVGSLYETSTQQYTYWYWVPGYLVAGLLVPIRCCVAIFLLRRLVPARWRNWRRTAVVAVGAAGVAAAYDPYQLTDPFRRVTEQRHSSRVAGTWPLAWEAAAFEPMLPEGAVLGAWDAGAIGYFAETPVVNLDGFANSYGYMRTDADKWALWLRRGGVPEFGVTHLVNVAPRRRTRGVAQVDYVGRGEGPGMLQLWPNGNQLRSSRSWRLIASPARGADGRHTGYRVIRHGRLVQVFVPACSARAAATNVPEMLVFAWREEAESRSERRLWLRPRSTPLGYCTETFLLPHGAETAAEILVDGTTVDRVVAEVPPLLRTRSGTTGYYYALHVVQRRLLWIREPAMDQPLDVRAERLKCYRRMPSRNFLHVYPAARSTLRQTERELGYIDLDGLLSNGRRSAGRRCLAEVELPAARIRQIVTGELVQGKRTWQAGIDGLALRPADIDEFLRAAVRILRTEGGDVYYHEDERKLLYVREGRADGAERSAGCAAEPVFAHVHPQRAGELPAGRRQYGFANYDFDFGMVGFVAGDRCFVAVQLPAWQVSHLVTGVAGGSPHIWHAG